MENTTKRFTINRTFILGIIAGIALAVAGMGIVAASGAGDDDAGEIESIERGALNVTDIEARDAVLEAYPGTTVEEVDLDTQSDGSLVYDVSLDNGKEIMVDARTGAVLGEEADDADDSGGDDED
ncbi:MAG: PepSY domain-containing protein [Chloroflexi bacterium]|nr:PepSY domain-containing protein [Chloroflexota bacterium]